MIHRCVNLDWLEVFVLEAEPMTAERFRTLGFVVDERLYGTRIYNEMFTLLDNDHQPFLEVRRNPKSELIPRESSHLRLVNRYCYFSNAADLMADFITRYQYSFQRIARVDICLDFERFDSGDWPQRFVNRYLSGHFSKINQANIHSHGRDTWDERCWNSLSWGSPTSMVGTKLYNKTMELKDPSTSLFRKEWIRQAWLECGLIDNIHNCTRFDADGHQYEAQIWRVEFSIHSSTKGWFTIELDGKRKNYQSIRNTLDMYNSRDKLLTLFASLAEHYFHFKHYVEGRRKDRCPDKVLFKWNAEQTIYHIDNGHILKESLQDRPLQSLLHKLRSYREKADPGEIRDACTLLIDVIDEQNLRSQLSNRFTLAEYKALQVTLSRKLAGDPTNAALIFRELKALLHLNDKTAPF